MVTPVFEGYPVEMLKELAPVASALVIETFTQAVGNAVRKEIE